MDQLSYYVFKGTNRCDFGCPPIVFQDIDLGTISNQFTEYLYSEMESYCCDGCGWCCYGQISSQEYCEIRFTQKSMLGQYLEMYKCKGYPINASVYKISFIPREQGGYFEEESLVWTLEEDDLFTTDHQIKV